MKAQAIAATHQAEEEAWAKGGGGIVKSVDPAAGTIVIASGLKTVTVTVTPQTIVRRYAGGLGAVCRCEGQHDWRDSQGRSAAGAGNEVGRWKHDHGR